MNKINELRIGFIINCLEIGGAQKSALTLHNLFKDKCKQIFFFQINKNKAGIKNRYNNETPEINPVSLTNLYNSSDSLLKILTTPSALRKLNSKSGKNIDILISFMERANILNLLTSKRIKKIISVRNYPSTFYAKKSFLKKIFINYGYKFLLKRADNINFNSLESALDFKRIFNIPNNKISVIYNILEKDSVINLSKEKLPGKYENLFSGKIIINVARLTYQKGQSRLIRAFKLVIQEIPDAKLIILGDGNLRNELNALIKKLNLAKNVFILGFRNNPYPFMIKSDLFVLSSTNEGFPNALIEAMALGLPVISTDCSAGPREILSPDTKPEIKTKDIDYAEFGILTPSFDKPVILEASPATKKEKIMSNAMIKILTDNNLNNKYSNLSRKRVNDFNKEKIVKEWEILLEKVFGEDI